MGFADAVAGQVPGVTAAMNDAFMQGLSTASLVVGALCLVGAVGALIALPGDRYEPLATPALRESDLVGS